MPKTKKASADKRRRLLKEKRLNDKSVVIKKKVENKEKTTKNIKDAKRIAKKRLNPEFLEADKKQKAEKRQNPENRAVENEKRAIKRQDPQYWELERQKILKKQVSEKQNDKKRKQSETYKDEKEVKRQMRAKEVLPVVSLYPTEFNQQICKGPTVTCSSCLRLWFATSCSELLRTKWENKLGREFCDMVYKNGTSNTFCQACLKSIKNQKIPTFCATNYKVVFEIPEELKGLSILEERMVAARIPFMQIRQVGYARQCSIKGQIVNVPLNVDTTAKILPRNLDDTHTIQIKLKRRMSHKNAYIFETVRPNTVLKALKYLIQQPLYVQEKITISDEWLENIETYIKSQALDSEGKNDDGSYMKCTSDDSSDSEGEEPLNPGGQETLLDKPSICENICYAPGENNVPKNLYLDPFADELSFPTLFCGHKKEFYLNFSYSTQVKVLTQNIDRRFARTDFLLYMFKKTQFLHLLNVVNMCLRQKKNEQGKYTAGDILKPNVLDQLIKKDAGFMFMSKIKSSPAYWKKEKGKLMSMIRQFGIPTFFFTVSAAETAWPELIQILSSAVDQKELTFEQAASLSYNEKTRLIRLDPITCARYFDHRFRLLFKHMKSEKSTFKNNPIDHFYYRVEFQHRGSPHIHGLLWLKDAPKYDKNIPSSADDCAKFAEKYVTCDGGLERVKHIIAFNIHHHSMSCQKNIKGTTVCRYGIPFLPMDETVILEPTVTEDKNLKKEMGDKFRKISEYLNKQNDVDFKQFLVDLGLSKKQYLNVIRHNILKVTMFLKRKPEDCFVNNYNEEMFTMQRANMDIQFVLDPWACAKYIVSYINKSQRGVSEIMVRAMEEMKRGNVDLKTKLKAVAGAFLNASEVSAQEAAYSLLQLHMHETCTSEVFINTKPIPERTKMLKSLEELKRMDPNDENIYVKGLLDHYPQRPDQLEDICLAEFAAYYTFNVKERKVRTSLPVKDGSGYVSKRDHAKIISFINYGFQQDPINYYREQIMLYVPWRNEVSQVQDVDQQLEYSMHVLTITENRKKFNVLDTRILDEALQEAEKYENQLANYVFHRELDEEYMPYGLDNPLQDPFDVLGQPLEKTEKRSFPTPFQINDDIYHDIISNLNNKQYEYLNHVLDTMTQSKILYNVVGGGAGVGKSRLISAIYQSLLRYYNSIPGNNPESIKVLLAAPTGKAAFGIGGITLHTAFSLPVNQFNKELIPLNNDVLNTIYCNLIDLKLIIIDEYSMVGAKMFDQVNQRLQQIFKSTSLFGNISVILVGDIRQLPPVGDKWIFLGSSNNPYNEICGTYLWDHFTYFELTEIMRQKDDKDFAIALNNMAGGTMSVADINLIKSREMSDDKILPDSVIHLFKSNIEVDAYNAEKLSTYNTESAVSLAKDTVKGSCSEGLRQLLLNYAKGLKKSESFGLMLKLILQIDAKYMISVNIDTQDGIVNGATGSLRKVEYNSGHSPKRVWIEFCDQRSGQETRKKHLEYMKQNNIPDTWTPIEKCARAIKIKKGSSCLVERLQFPLLISEGITIHKSQGATYDQVAVHISRGMSRNSIYVACSRATKLNGLFIFGEFRAPNKPSEKDFSFIELSNLRNEKYLKSKYRRQYILDKKDKHIFAYQNVQSLNKHKSFIQNNPIFANADILLFVETWLGKTDNVDLTNYDCFANLCNLNYQRKPFGICCYKKHTCAAKVVVDNIYTKTILISTFQAVMFYFNDIYIVVVYIPPKFKINDAKLCLDEILKGRKQVLIIGDFNLNLADAKYNRLKQCLTDNGFCSKINDKVSTTISGTHIDWCFSDLNCIKADVYSTIYSHHKAIAVNVYENDITDLTMFPSQTQQPTVVENQIQLRAFTPQTQQSMDIDETVLSDNSSDESSIENLDIVNLTLDSNESLTPTSTPMPLLNIDGVSCYANASLQCLLSLEEFRTSVSKDDCLLNTAICKLIRKQSDNCLEIRRLIGNQFALHEQQDTSEFLGKLIDRLDVEDFSIYIKSIIYPDVLTCEFCGFHRLGEDTFCSIHNLHFPENCAKVLPFSEMLTPRNSDRLCECRAGNLKSSSMIRHVNKYIVITLIRTQFVNNQLIKIHTTFTNFDSENITINNINFKVKAVIKHFGQSIQSGHYVAEVRYGSRWYICNDSQISKRNEPFDNTLKDVYVLVLEKR